jgi:hypothetical protein
VVHTTIGAGESPASAVRPFARLVAHFLARLARSGSQVADTEFELGIGGLLGVLAAPGAFACLLLLDKYSTLLNWLRGRLHQDLYVTSYPDKYLFIALAMAVTGIVTVLKWDRIVPDAQDYLNLAPLPIPARNILLANMAAILIAVLVFAIDVNGVSMLAFPLFVTAAAQTAPAEFLRFAVVHAACTVLASIFTFCLVFAVLGAFSAILPRTFFRSLSSWLRGIVLVGLIALLVTGFTGPTQVVRLIGPGNERFLPPFWFTGLYQALQNRHAPAIDAAASVALPATAAALLVVVISYALGYRRNFRSVLESEARSSRNRLPDLAVRCLDLFAGQGTGFARASHRFTVRALLRSEPHRLCLAVFGGLGWLMALQEIVGGSPEEGFLGLSYLLLLGLRIALDMPASVAANWLFRTVLEARSNRSAQVAQRVMLGFLVPLVILPCLVFCGPLQALFVLAASVGLSEALLARYRKFPLACPLPGFRENFLVLVLAYLLGFEAFTHLGAGVERWLLSEPIWFVPVFGFLAAAWSWNRGRIRRARAAGELEDGLVFENLSTPVVETMNLFEG